MRADYREVTACTPPVKARFKSPQGSQAALGASTAGIFPHPEASPGLRAEEKPRKPVLAEFPVHRNVGGETA